MDRVPSGVDSVRELLRRRIKRCSTRIARAKNTGAKPRHQARPGAAEFGAAVAVRRAYQDVLRALDTILPDAGAAEASRLAAKELARVKSAVARIYEVAQHGHHDLDEAGDWAIVEGEAQAALNVFHENEQGR